MSKKKLNQIIFYIIAIFLAAVLLFPYLFMVNRGLMSNAFILRPETNFWTDGLNLNNYVLAFSNGGYLKPLLNSFFVCGIVCISTPLTTLIAAYAFAKLEWVGKKAIFGLMMLTMLVPAVVTQVPLFVLYGSIGFLNTLYPMFLPSLFFCGAPGVFLTRQFLYSIPKDLEESAYIDGAGALRRCFQICAPICKPILIYLGVMSFMSAWGDYYTPSIYYTKEDAPFTFAYALFYMTGRQENAAHPEWIFAAATIMSIVPIVLFAGFQKFLLDGMATSGLKG